MHLPHKTRRTSIRHVDSHDYDFLFHLLGTEAGPDWRFAGRTPRPENFHDELWSSVLAQVVISEGDRGDRIGFAQIYGASFTDGHATISTAVVLDPAKRTWAFEGVVAFIHYCFETFPFRKLCFQVLADDDQFASGAGDYFEHEGTVPSAGFRNGELVDAELYALWRDHWYSTVVPFVGSMCRIGDDMAR